MNLDLPTVLRTFGMVSAQRSGKKDWVDALGQLPGMAEYVPLLRGTIAPALSGFGRQRDTSLDDVEADDALSDIESPIAMLDRITQEAKEANAKRDAEVDAKLQSQALAAKSQPKPMKSRTVDRWKQATQDAASEPAQAEGLPEVQPGYVRMYHGGTNAFGGKQWLSPDQKFAERNTLGIHGAQVRYVDIEESHKSLQLDTEAAKANTKPTYKAFEADEDIVNRLKPVRPSAQQQQQQSPPKPQSTNSSTLEEDLSSIVSAQNSNSRPAAPGVEAPPIQNEAGSSNGEPSSLSTATDAAQSALDAVGVVDPTPISDGINAVWSLGRAFTDPERRGEHLTNAAISTVSMVPYIGDAAKLLKTGRYAKTASRLSKWNEGASAVTKTTQRGKYREAVGSVLGGRAGGNSGDGGEIVEQGSASSGNGGGNIPPTPPGLSPGADDEREGEAAARGFFDQIKGAGEAVLAFTGPLSKGYIKLAAFVQGIELLNAGVIGLNRDLAPFNGQLSAAYARGDADQLQRDIRKGNDIAGPMSALIDEQSELKDSLDKIRNPIQAIAYTGLAGLTSIINTVLKYEPMFNIMTFSLQKIAAWLPDLGGTTDPAAMQFFRDVSDGKFDGREPQFGGRGVGRMPEFKTEQERRDLFGP
jgi:hypothetical protein